MSEVGEFEDTEDEVEDKEMLFLIEFLVDTLCLNMRNIDTKRLDPCMLQGQTCVVLTFLNFPPMTLCDKDWGPENDDSTDDRIKFNAGKSLMFALSESQFGNPPPIFLDVTAHKLLPHGSPEPKLPIGVTKICLTELFKQVFDKIDEKPDKLPVSKSIKDTYQIMGSNARKPTGEIIIYIRLSCLGQNVVTEFQRGGDECDPFLFKNKESNKVYECKPKDDLSDGGDGDVCPPCPGLGGGRKGGGASSCGGGLSEHPIGTGVPEIGVGGGGGGVEYEEFGTEVHGHSLTVKIAKSKKKSGRGASEEGIIGNQITFEVPQDQTLCRSGRGNNKAEVLSMKGCDGQGGGSGGGGGGTVLTLPEGSTAEDKDIFVLRIGKKGEVNGKGKLELELRTPKLKVDRGPRGPRMVDREVQTDKEEAPKKPKKGKK